MLKPSIKPVHCLAAISLLIVFVIDILTPSAFVVDILYLCSILLVFKQNTKTIISFTAAACLLIIIDLLFFHQNGNPGSSLWVNRGISIFAILLTSYIAKHYRQLNKSGKFKEQRNLTTLEDILFITSHQVRKPVANILGLIDIISKDNAALPGSDLSMHCQYLSSSAIELDNYIKELNAFIEQTGQQSHPGLITPPALKALIVQHGVHSDMAAAG